MKKAFLICLTLAVVIWSIVQFGNEVLRLFESDAPSISKGSTADGSLENGKRLPTRGLNFSTYSRLGSLLGRNAVHAKVRDTMLDAFQMLESTNPELEFVVGETGWVKGGPFPPHRTHQNGLSVDIMSPVRNQDGAVVKLPVSVLNKFGYDIEFDDQGEHAKFNIDYEAMALHIRALIEAGRKHGVSIGRVIFDPVLQPYLFATENGRGLDTLVRFSSRRAWVRHDDHYHIDFRIE